MSVLTMAATRASKLPSRSLDGLDGIADLHAHAGTVRHRPSVSGATRVRCGADEHRLSRARGGRRTSTRTVTLHTKSLDKTRRAAWPTEIRRTLSPSEQRLSSRSATRRSSLPGPSASMLVRSPKRSGSPLPVYSRSLTTPGRATTPNRGLSQRLKNMIPVPEAHLPRHLINHEDPGQIAVWTMAQSTARSWTPDELAAELERHQWTPGPDVAARLEALVGVGKIHRVGEHRYQLHNPDPTVPRAPLTASLRI
jgi:hypothetical protein